MAINQFNCEIKTDVVPKWYLFRELGKKLFSKKECMKNAFSKAFFK